MESIRLDLGYGSQVDHSARTAESRVSRDSRRNACAVNKVCVRVAQVKKIGFLSFGAWHPGGGLTHTGGDALRQTVELAVAAESIGIDGAFVRVHHFARQLSSPFPLLASIGVSTRRIEIGTGVIDMRYENPLYMAEQSAAADLLAGGRLQLGVSRGSPEPAWHGAEAFGYSPDGEQARDKTALFRAPIDGAGMVRADVGGRPGDTMLAVQPQSPGLADRIWW